MLTRNDWAWLVTLLNNEIDGIERSIYTINDNPDAVKMCEDQLRELKECRQHLYDLTNKNVTYTLAEDLEKLDERELKFYRKEITNFHQSCLQFDRCYKTPPVFHNHFKKLERALTEEIERRCTNIDVQVPDQWKGIVDEAVAKMKAITPNFNLEVKEKWKRLVFVFYGELPPEYEQLQAIADEAERRGGIYGE